MYQKLLMCNAILCKTFEIRKSFKKKKNHCATTLHNPYVIRIDQSFSQSFSLSLSLSRAWCICNRYHVMEYASIIIQLFRYESHWKSISENMTQEKRSRARDRSRQRRCACKFPFNERMCHALKSCTFLYIACIIISTQVNVQRKFFFFHSLHLEKKKEDNDMHKKWFHKSSKAKQLATSTRKWSTYLFSRFYSLCIYLSIFAVYVYFAIFFLSSKFFGSLFVASRCFSYICRLQSRFL